MKQLLPLLFTLFLAIQMQAQIELVIEPNPYVETFELDLSDAYIQGITHGIVINDSDESINLRWELVTDGAGCPGEWQYQVCDNNQCYSFSVTSNVVVGGQPNVPVELAPGDTSILEFHIKPNGTEGCCNPVIKLSTAENPGNVLATADYDVCIEALTSVNEAQKANLRIYPNPTTNFISVSNNNFVKKLFVSNILGKRVKSFQTNFNSQYDISDLPDGIYLVSMIDAYNKVIKTVRISKRNIRP